MEISHQNTEKAIKEIKSLLAFCCEGKVTPVITNILSGLLLSVIVSTKEINNRIELKYIDMLEDVCIDIVDDIFKNIDNDVLKDIGFNKK